MHKKLKYKQNKFFIRYVLLQKEKKKKKEKRKMNKKRVNKRRQIKEDEEKIKSDIKVEGSGKMKR